MATRCTKGTKGFNQEIRKGRERELATRCTKGTKGFNQEIRKSGTEGMGGGRGKLESGKRKVEMGTL